MENSIKALIFDVDGTLSETEELHRKAFNLAFKEKKINWYWDFTLYKKLIRYSVPLTFLRLGSSRFADFRF